MLLIYPFEISAKRSPVSPHWWALKGGVKMNPKTIGEHLKKRRLELGWGQQQVAEATGYIWLIVSNGERGVCRPTKQAMVPILAFLGYDPRAEKYELNT